MAAIQTGVPNNGVAPWQNITAPITIPGRSALNLDSVTRVRNFKADFAVPLAKDLEALAAQVNKLTAQVSLTVPAQIVSVRQGQIAALKLSATDAGRFVYVTDFYHLLQWDGGQFHWAGEESNWFAYSDHGPPKAGGFVPCHGQQVTYLLQNGKVASRVLPDTYRRPGFLQLGSGDGVWEAAVAPTVSGTASVTGTCTITGTGTITSGSCSVTNLPVSASGNLSITGTGITISGIGVGGSVSPGVSIALGGSATLTSTALGGSCYWVASDYTNAASVNTALTGTGSWSTSGIGIPTASISTGSLGGSVGGSIIGGSASISYGGGAGTSAGPFFVDTGDFASNGGDIDGAISSIGLSVSFGTWGGSVSYGGPSVSVTYSAGTWPVSPGTMALYSGALFYSGSTDVSVNTFGLYVNSNAITTSTLYVPSFTLYASSGLTITYTTPSISGMTLTAATINGGGLTVSGTGTISGTVAVTGTGTITGSGPVTATVSNTGTPPAWAFQAWFRI